MCLWSLNYWQYVNILQWNLFTLNLWTFSWLNYFGLTSTDITSFFFFLLKYEEIRQNFNFCHFSTSLCRCVLKAAVPFVFKNNSEPKNHRKYERMDGFHRRNHCFQFVFFYVKFFVSGWGYLINWLHLKWQRHFFLFTSFSQTDTSW